MLFLKRLLGIALMTVWLVACSSPVSQANYDKIQNGMSLTEVKAILGEPAETQTMGIGGLSGTSATWANDKGLKISIQFVNDKVQLKNLLQ